MFRWAVPTVDILHTDRYCFRTRTHSFELDQIEVYFDIVRFFEQMKPATSGIHSVKQLNYL